MLLLGPAGPQAACAQVVELFACQDRVAQLAWCPRSEKVACRLHGRNFLQVTRAVLEADCATTMMARPARLCRSGL